MDVGVSRFDAHISPLLRVDAMMIIFLPRLAMHIFGRHDTPPPPRARSGTMSDDRREAAHKSATATFDFRRDEASPRRHDGPLPGVYHSRRAGDYLTLPFMDIGAVYEPLFAGADTFTRQLSLRADFHDAMLAIAMLREPSLMHRHAHIIARQHAHACAMKFPWRVAPLFDIVQERRPGHFTPRRALQDADTA